MNEWYETEGFIGPTPAWERYLKAEALAREKPICPDCGIPAEKFITTAAQLYGVPYEDYPAYPSAFQPRWDGEWFCSKCQHIVAITNRQTGEIFYAVRS